MTTIDIVMTPDEDKATIRNAYIRKDKGGKKYVIYLDLPFHFTDTKELENISKWLDVRRSNITKRFYIVGYLPPEYLTYYNNLSLDDGDEYFIPALEVDRREREAGFYSFHILSEDMHLIRRVGPVVKSKEESKMSECIIRDCIIQRCPCILDLDGDGPMYHVWLELTGAPTNIANMVPINGFKKDDTMGLYGFNAQYVQQHVVCPVKMSEVKKHTGLKLDDGRLYKIPELIVRSNGTRNTFGFTRNGWDDISVLYDGAHAGKSDKNKEENKMATTYDAKTGKKYYDYTQASAAYRSAFGIDKVVYSPPATIVFWKDGSKTVVKCSENDVFDPLAGIAFALMRKVYGKEYRNVEKYAKEYEKQHPPVDISVMAGCVMSEKEYWDDVFATYDDTHDVSNDGAPAKKVGETTVDDSELKPMSFDTVGGEMVQKAVADLEKELGEGENNNGAHE